MAIFSTAKVDARHIETKNGRNLFFYITDTSNHISMMSNMLEKYKEERYYYNIANTSINIVAGGVSDNVVSGTDATVIDMKGNSSTTASSNAKNCGICK